MGIRKRTDDMRASTRARRAGPAARAKPVGVVAHWKEQLAAGRDLELTGEPPTNDERGDPNPSGKPLGTGRGDYETLSAGYIFVSLVAIALACVGGYFLLMKLIDISSPERCVMAGGRNCAAVTVPSDR